jgi:CheY-like chemotaxis protein
MQLSSGCRKSRGDRRTILYIEDNFVSVRLIEEILHEQANIELLTTMEAQIGLDLARQHSPDLILLDLGLPDLPRLDVLSRTDADYWSALLPRQPLSILALREQGSALSGILS